MQVSPLRWTRKDLCFALLQLGALCAFVIQLLISADPVNLECVGWVVISSSLVFQYLWRSNSPEQYPVSALALLGLCVTTVYAALLAQSVDGAPLIELLRWPQTTFRVLAAVLFLSVLGHWIYRHLAAPQAGAQRITRLVHRPLKIVAIPSVHMIWLMSGVGAYALATGGGVATGDVGGKAFQALNFLAYMPFLIPIYHRQYGARYCTMKTQGPLIAGYVALLCVIGMALNARQLMVIGPVQALLMYLVYAWRDERPVTRSTVKWLLVSAVSLMIAIAMFAQLATAMVLVRDKRDTLKPWELIKETVTTLTDSARMAQYRQDALLDARYKVFDETYLSNPVMARFSETKFHDNTIYFGTRLTDRDRSELWDATIDKSLAILPQNLLDALEIRVEKDDYAFSFGDYYRYLNEGLDNTLGGFSVGSVWAHLLGLFGIEWFPVVVLLLVIPSSMYLDSFVTREQGVVNIAPVIMCSAWSLFSYALGSESLAWKIGFYLRDIPQKMLLYTVMYLIIMWGTQLFGRRLDATLDDQAEARGEPT
ncbi:MAG: hypothetical protein HY836_03200 [Aquabacterium sp.]|uniref:hypothetical protein n=1 Tax=Aquabacterium sp. TaxID=1872578 RepID=UPI0025C1AF25|nr:hypothetical protein [Aquabacterium sp.]MBI5924580.1 hypothetical protein [Aquabacterium sp.]